MAKPKNSEDVDAGLLVRLAELFAGNEDHSGTHGEPDSQDGVKWSIKKTARTLRETATEDHWHRHLTGQRPLGVVPIRRDDTCVWGSIDIDDYDADVAAIVSAVDAQKLPLVPCRSKSGGLHLFMFARAPAPAATMQSVLRDIAASLGLGGCEIFPKQTHLHTEKGDLGNWMVMPYFGGDYGGKLRMQRGVKKTGAEMTLAEFVAAAEAARVDPEKVSFERVRSTKSKREVKPFGDGPPCLVHLASLRDGIPQGGQNNAAFHMGVYFKRASPADWQQRLEEANQKYMRPPLPSEELSGVIRSLEKKDYQYKCKDQPMARYCDAVACRMRKFGVGAGAAYPIITGLSKLKTEPPVWFVDVEGGRLSMSTEDLQSYQRFHRHCMEHLNKTFSMMKNDTWFALLNEAMQPERGFDELDAPPDGGIDAVFLEHLETFLTNRQRGKVREDLLSGRPWEDEEAGRFYFQLAPLTKFLEREGVRDVKRNDLIRRIERLGGKSQQLLLKGDQNRFCWWIPSEKLRAPPKVDAPKVEGEGL